MKTDVDSWVFTKVLVKSMLYPIKMLNFLFILAWVLRPKCSCSHRLSCSRRSCFTTTPNSVTIVNVVVAQTLCLMSHPLGAKSAVQTYPQSLAHLDLRPPFLSLTTLPHWFCLRKTQGKEVTLGSNYPWCGQLNFVCY